MNVLSEGDDENAWERYNEADPRDHNTAAAVIRKVPWEELPLWLRDRLARIRKNEPLESAIDYYSLRRLMQRHNQATALLEEFLALHPEESDLTWRAQRLVDNPE